MALLAIRRSTARLILWIMAFVLAAAGLSFFAGIALKVRTERSAFRQAHRAHTTDLDSAVSDPVELAAAKASLAEVRVVVSMSSFAGRLERVRETIQSLAGQSRRPDKIYIHAPLAIKRINVSSELPPIVDELKETYKGLLEFTHPEDYGPSTKLLGTLLIEKDPDTIVITVDDDIVYHEHMVLALVQAAQARRAAICFICEFWPWWWYKPIYHKAPGVCQGFANAFAGIAYRVGFFEKDVFDYSKVPRGCRLHDDVYLSGYLFRKGVRPYVITPGFSSTLYDKGHTSFSINKVKNTETEYRDPCLRFFSYMHE
ncbi:hypothetical protein DFJ73DRAFT_846974 [Zopfochytrium polystomum]|nr:hypothetical protein DFJ73DRAFT_846974 [Zopfochytrium polystomum]